MIHIEKPIQQPCDGTPVTFFSAGTIASYSGTITVTNTNPGSGCLIGVTYVDADGTHDIVIGPTPATIPVNQVTSIIIECACNFPTACPELFCNGAFKADFTISY
ncbi:hypothetical protein [Bacillus sp. CDB3]|uniref:hypothetical protein n=1 Tax=Bacillus sp. CDB3 TaxID=360310 RepID=UPI001C4DFAEA|nr:hypothetical protein [Bacillus sp. CDB3]